MAAMRKFLVLIGLMLALTTLGGLQPARAEGGDTTSVATTFKQAWTAANVDALVAQFADDAVIIEPTLGLNLRGKAEFRAFVEGFLQQNPGFSISWSESATILDTSVQRDFISSDPIRAVGVSRIVEINTIVVFQGKIVSSTGILDLSDPETAKFAAAVAGR